jgi:indole-3-glycerol phosphate synthase
LTDVHPSKVDEFNPARDADPPALRKDFMYDTYRHRSARPGADAILIPPLS